MAAVMAFVIAVYRLGTKRSAACYQTTETFVTVELPFNFVMIAGINEPAVTPTRSTVLPSTVTTLKSPAPPTHTARTAPALYVGLLEMVMVVPPVIGDVRFAWNVAKSPAISFALSSRALSALNLPRDRFSFQQTHA